MIYKEILYETRSDAKFIGEKWEIAYTLTQSRVSLTDIPEKRELVFKIETDDIYDTAYKKLMRKAFDALQSFSFDLFKMSDEEFLSTKARLEDVATKNNQTSKN